MKANNKPTCDPCEQDFKKSVNELVREGQAPSHAEREKRSSEVKAAFGHAAAQAGKAPADKPRVREHALAGGAKKSK